MQTTHAVSDCRILAQTVSQGGCNHFIVHARKAWLKVRSMLAAKCEGSVNNFILNLKYCSNLPVEQGVDPKKNRSVPPLQYDR